MPIKINLDLRLVMKQMSLTELSEKTGLSLQTLSILKTRKARGIRFDTLEQLCRVLECQPGDLFEYVL